MRKFLLILLSILIVLAAVLAWTAPTGTPPILDREGEELAGSIAEERMISLGGTEQYVLIRGHDRRNPVLIFLHGGPGSSAMAFNRVHHSALEEHFVTVEWDQRGTGFSYAAGQDSSSMTMARISGDLDELVDLLLEEFDQTGVILVGHSWGSMLGLDYIANHPDKVHGYIGIGQMADTAASETEVYHWAVKVADEANDQDALATLSDIGPPPYEDVEELMRHRDVVTKFGGSWRDGTSDLRFARTAMRAPEFSWTGLRDTVRGLDRSLAPLFPTFSTLDAFETYPRVEVPIAFFLGRDDRVVSPTVAAKYLEAVEAPWKKLIWFEKSAHNPNWEEPARYQSQLRATVAEMLDLRSDTSARRDADALEGSP